MAADCCPSATPMTTFLYRIVAIDSLPHLAIDLSRCYYVSDIVTLLKHWGSEEENRWLKTNVMSRVLAASDTTAAVFQLMTAEQSAAHKHAA